MKLFKSCKSKYNIENGCKTLRVGTLYGYRKEENPDIRDEGEGSYHFMLDIQKAASVSLDVAETFTSGMIGFGAKNARHFRGSFSGRMNLMHIIKADSKQVTFGRSNILIERNSPNQYVFCMSLTNGAPPVVSGEYDSYWAIAEESAEKFAIGAAQALLEAVKERPSSVVGLEGKNLDSIFILYRHDTVKYLARHIMVSDFAGHTVDNFVEKMDNMAFTKPEKFSHEIEYRFSFEVTNGVNFYPPAEDSISLNVQFIESLISP